MKGGPHVFKRPAIKRSAATTVAELVGIALVSVGTGFIYWQAGLIVAGLAIFAIGVIQA